MAKKNVLTRSLRKKADNLFQSNKFPEAAAVYEKICNTDRMDVDARVMLAISTVQSGDIERAKQLCETAIKIEPDHALAHHALGTVHLRQNKITAAISEFKQAITLKPGFSNAHLFLADALSRTDKSDAAEESYAKALELEPGLSGAIAGMARLYTQSGRIEDAVHLFNQALQHNPDNSQLLSGLGEMLVLLGKTDEAMATLQKAIAIDPDSYEASFSLGNLLMKCGKYDSAIDSYKNASRIRPDDEYAIGAIAQILERRSEFVKALELLKPFVAAGSRNAGITLPYAELSAQTGHHVEAIEALQNTLQPQDLAKDTRMEVLFKLGKLNDSIGNYASAFDNYQQGNQITKGICNTLDDAASIDTQAELIAAQLEGCTIDFWRSITPLSNKSTRPVFVVGMPRSGTTLIEQILASHPKIYGAGELGIIESIARSLCQTSPGKAQYPTCLPEIPTRTLDLSAASYLQHLQELSPAAERVVDKYPHNFMHLGLISILFPESRIIHISREPMDTCLSVYFQIFSPQHAYATDLEHLGRHYATYERIMRYWNKTLDIPIMNIKYEALLQEPEQTIRSILEFCDVPWNADCLSFHEKRRDISTPSYDQVRRPLYQQSIGRWKNYRANLNVLAETLSSERTRTT